MIFRSITYWLNSLPPPPGGLPPAVFYLPIFALVLFVLSALAFKPFLLKFMPTQLRFQTVDAERVPKLDRAALQHLTQEFEALGFVRLGDITNTAGIAAFNDPASEGAEGGQNAMNTPRPPLPSPTAPPPVNSNAVKSNYEIVPGFCRVFGHPQHGCLAEVNQHYPAGGTATPFSCAVLSQLDQGWDLTTSSRRAEAIFYLLRRPHGARFTHQGARPAALLQAHLEERRRLQSELGLGVAPLCTLEDYVTAERKGMAESREVLVRKNPLSALWEVLRFMIAPKREWPGERSVS